MRRFFLMIFILNIAIYSCFASNDNTKNNNNNNFIESNSKGTNDNKQNKNDVNNSSVFNTSGNSNTARSSFSNTSSNFSDVDNNFMTLLFDYIKNNTKDSGKINKIDNSNNNINAFVDTVIQYMISGNLKEVVIILNRKQKNGEEKFDLLDKNFSSKFGITFLMFVAKFIRLQKEAVKFIKMISKYFLEVAYDIFGSTALMYAALFDNVVFAKNCNKLEFGTIKNRFGKTALMYAAIRASAEFIDLLLKKNKNLLGIKDNDNRSSLMYAAAYGNINAVKVILKYDTESKEILVKDKDGNNVLFILIKLLGEYINSIRKLDNTNDNFSIIGNNALTRGSTDLDISRQETISSRHGLPIVMSDNQSSIMNRSFGANSSNRSMSSITNSLFESSISVGSEQNSSDRCMFDGVSVFSTAQNNSYRNENLDDFRIEDISISFRLGNSRYVAIENYMHIIRYLFQTCSTTNMVNMCDKKFIAFVIDNNLVDVFLLIVDYFNKIQKPNFVGSFYRKKGDPNSYVAKIGEKEIREILDEILSEYLKNKYEDKEDEDDKHDSVDCDTDSDKHDNDDDKSSKTLLINSKDSTDLNTKK